jgi:DNA-binding XRE family transcriptional regulator
MTTNKRLLTTVEKDLAPITFGMFLRAARVSKDLSQSEMARFLGISRGTLCDIEKGRQLVSPTLAAKIAKKAGLSTTVAVKACLQDQLDKAKIKLTVDLKAS